MKTFFNLLKKSQETLDQEDDQEYPDKAVSVLEAVHHPICRYLKVISLIVKCLK